MTALPVRAPARTRGFPKRAEPARRPDLRLVEAPDRVVRRHRRTIVFFAGVAVLALLTIVAFYALLAASQVKIDQLDRRTQAAEREYEQARYEHARLSAPQRIVERASALGLVAPAVPPTPIAVTGDAPAAPDATSPTLTGYADVKPTLGTGP
jgi:Bacteriodetes cell division protein (FtsL-like)